MSDFGMNEMQEMQKALQEKYKQKWEPICPATGQSRRSDRYREKERSGRCGGKRRTEKASGRGNGGCSDVLQRCHALLWDYGGGIKGGVYGEI